jgi:hypothetical protein
MFTIDTDPTTDHPIVRFDNPTGFVDYGNLRWAASRARLHWFNADTMRTFASRIYDVPHYVTHAGRPVIAWISSERDRYPGPQAWDGRRLYTLRAFDGHRITSIGEFGQYETIAAARRAFKSLPRL